MKSVRKTLRPLVLCAGALVLALSTGASATAAETKKYTYRGDAFTDAMAPFDTKQTISGYFIIDCGLAGGSGDCRGLRRANYRSAVVAFSFTAGQVTIDQGSPGVRDDDFTLITDSAGNLRYWQVDLLVDAGLLLSDNLSHVEDLVCLSAECARQASNFESPGSWTIETIGGAKP